MIRTLAHQAIPWMWAFVELVSDEGGRLEATETAMLSHEELDPVRVGHGEEVVTFPNVVFLHGERVLQEASNYWRETWSFGDPPGHRLVGFENFPFSPCGFLTFTKFLFSISWISSRRCWYRL